MCGICWGGARGLAARCTKEQRQYRQPRGVSYRRITAEKLAEEIFTAQFKRRIRLLAGLILFAAGTAPFAVGLLIITYLLPSATGPAAAAVTTIAFALGILLPLVSQDQLALLGNASLRRRVAEKVGTSDYPREGMEFVGFSPGDTLRVWEGETDRDVGFLELTGTALVCRGDSFAWRLHRESLDSLERLETPGAPRRIIIGWHTPGQPSRQFTLASREARTLKGSNHATIMLYRKLKQWSEQAPGDAEVPTLGSPPTSTKGSVQLEKVPAGSCLSVLSIALMTMLTVWYIAQRLILAGLYYHAILWSGLIAVGAMILASYFLSYLQATEARQSSRRSTPE